MLGFMSENTCNIAIVGLGNCATSLIQGIHLYSEATADQDIPGLMHTKFGPYAVGDVKVVAAFDVDADKVGKDVADAIESGQNCTIKIADVPTTGEKTEVTVKVQGMHFVPDVIEVPKGNELVVTFENTGDVVHDLVFANNTGSAQLTNGQSEVIEVGVIGADLDGWCSVSNHRQLGMVMKVKAAWHSWLARRANNSKVVGSRPTVASFCVVGLGCCRF